MNLWKFTKTRSWNKCLRHTRLNGTKFKFWQIFWEGALPAPCILNSVKFLDSTMSCCPFASLRIFNSGYGSNRRHILWPHIIIIHYYYYLHYYYYCIIIIIIMYYWIHYLCIQLVLLAMFNSGQRTINLDILWWFWYIENTALVELVALFNLSINNSFFIRPDLTVFLCYPRIYYFFILLDKAHHTSVSFSFGTNFNNSIVVI